jgi:S-adenosylmethionine:tRNA ribosyltransferase-isomerase
MSLNKGIWDCPQTYLNIKNEFFIMQLTDFDYGLPKELIAQKPAEPRDSSRLMVLKKSIEHRIFRDFPEYLEPGDVLVINDTKVLKARIFGRKETGGKIEALLLRKIDGALWEALLKGKVRVGANLDFSGHRAKVVEKEEGKALLEFSEDPRLIMEEQGVYPLPPYIKNYDGDLERYQTVFAEKNGAVAAPTAGLHFTPEILKEIEKKGVDVVHITLHVGWGTFKPVKVENIEEHKMEKEWYEISREAAERINSREGRLFAVGTTTVRTLESSSMDGAVIPGSGETELFIYPGYTFKSGIDALLTNFHLPKSTLLMLVTAFGGYERIMEAYKIAVKERYRFFSFGDAMLIFKK